jgi:hypothetical protein
MQHTKYHKKDIFCIEGFWKHDRRKKMSIEKAMDFLQENSTPRINKTFLRCSTIAEFKAHIAEFGLMRNDRSGILYLAFHGSPNALHVEKRRKLKLLDADGIEQLATIIDGSAKGKIIHFGSCSTLNMPPSQIKLFLQKTGAAAVSGYNEEVNFIETTLLDILFFEACQLYKRPSSISKYMKTNYGGFMKRSGFRIYF